MKKSDRVKLTQYAKDQCIHRDTFDRLGTVVFVSGDYIGVLRDGTKCAVRYHKDFWESAKDAERD